MDHSSHSLSFSPSCSSFPTYTISFQATVKPIQKGIRIHFHEKRFVLSCHLLLHQPPNPHVPFPWFSVSHIRKLKVFFCCTVKRSLRELLFFMSNSSLLKQVLNAYSPLYNANLNLLFFMPVANLILKVLHALQILTFIVFTGSMAISSPLCSAVICSLTKGGPRLPDWALVLSHRSCSWSHYPFIANVNSLYSP